MSARTASLVCFALVLGAAQGRALGLLEDDRFTRYERRTSEFEPVTSGMQVPESFFGPFPPQSSVELDDDLLGFGGTASGSSGGWFDYSGVVLLYSWNESQFSLTFRIDGEGTIAAQGLLRGDYEGGSASFALRDATSTLYSASSRQMENYTPFDFETTVEPGVYTLYAFTGDHADDGQGHFDFTYSVRDTAVPVPEPATAALLAAGLALLRRRHG